MQIAAITWDIDPTIFSIGGFSIAYYGVLWVAAFIMGSYLFRIMLKKEGLNPEMEYSAFMTMLIATIIGARLGHCLFYEPAEFLAKPWTIITGIRDGGLASHGATIGLLIGIWFWSRKWKMPYVWLVDRIGIVAAIGGAFIRFGNLMNSEIYGTATDLPWGFIFVRRGETMAMHPTQVYEMIAYLITFALLWYLYKRTKISDRRGMMFGIAILMIFGSRFLIESIKQPQEVWEQTMSLNMGQLLSLPLIFGSIALIIFAARRPAQPYNHPKYDSNTKPSSGNHTPKSTRK